MEYTMQLIHVLLTITHQSIRKYSEKIAKIQIEKEVTVVVRLGSLSLMDKV